MQLSSANLDTSGECLDAATSRLLMKKTWCHGQVIAAFQGVFYAWWAYQRNDMLQGSRRFLTFSALLLPVWTLTSWCAMRGQSSHDGWVILGFGGALLLYYVVVLFIAMHASGDPLQLPAIIVTALQFVETSAYLTVVACLKDALVEDTNQDQYGLM